MRRPLAALRALLWREVIRFLRQRNRVFGALLQPILFWAIFSTVSVIEDRREGFLQSVLVAPVPRSIFVLGKVLGGTVLAVAQGLVLLVLAPLAGLRLTATVLGESCLI